jgi:hypothetical protein
MPGKTRSSLDKKQATRDTPDLTPSQLIDTRIKELAGWRGGTLARLREIITRAVPDAVEEWKWDVPVWSSAGGGIICTGEAYKATVKLTFAKGASAPDPAGLFNSSLEGNTRRAIDFREGDRINAKALAALVRSASALNTPASPAFSRPKKTTKKR